MSFESEFKELIEDIKCKLTAPDGRSWSVKGFIDFYKNIYSISIDTKVVSKIIELMIFPIILNFSKNKKYELKLSPHQNYYPDITIIDKIENKKYAIDIKSSYRIDDTKINGMTLGAFTGYFRTRDSTKNILFPYSDYEKHFVFGIIYSRTDISKVYDLFKKNEIKINGNQRKLILSYLSENTDEKWEKLNTSYSDKLPLKIKKTIDSFIINETEIYNLDNFHDINSVVRDFDFFFQEKWKLAIDRPGSGNTKNIGSENVISKLKNGEGLFKKEFGDKGKEIFDNFWMNYETKDMAIKVGRQKPNYSNLKSYKKWIESLKEIK